MKKVALLLSAAGLGISQGIRAWMRTLRYRVAYYDPALDPMHGCDQPRLYVFWHEYILLPLYIRGHCDLTMLLSRHHDADVLDKIARRMGFESVRGSTSRGSITALREMARAGENHHLTITPDGPRGPRRHMAQGPIYLASKLGIPIVPLGFAYRRPWRATSWDRFAIPRPFSQARAIVGPALTVDENPTRTEMEEARVRLELLLNHLTTQAEDWADSGYNLPGSIPGRREPRRPGPAMEPTRPAVPLLEVASPEEFSVLPREAA